MYGEAQMGVSSTVVDKRVGQVFSVKELPQFPIFLKSVHKLHTVINKTAANDTKLKHDREVANAIRKSELQWFDAFSKIEPGTTLPPKIEPILPPEERYSASSSWSEFVLHDMRGVVTTTIGPATILEIIPERDSEAESLLQSGKIAAKKYKNTSLSLRERIDSISNCVTQFSRHIDSVRENVGGKLDPYSEMINDAKNTAKIWDMISRSALMLNGVKNEDYGQVSMWFKELQKTKVRVGDIFPVTAKRIQVISDPQIWDKKNQEGEKNMLFCDQKLLDKQVDGVQGVMLFNLVKNANVHKKSKILVSEHDGELMIENDLVKPMESPPLFEPGKYGEGGGTGYGLFTVKNIYGTLSGRDVICTGITGSDETPHRAIFTIKQKSQ